MKGRIELLPFSLELCSIKHSDIGKSMHALLRLALLDNQPEFLCFTRTDSEYSCLLEQKYLHLFDHSVVCSGTVWRPLSVVAGEQGLDSNIAHLISEPLAKHNISILQISTFQGDFTLVPAELVDLALKCLSNLFTVQEPVSIESKSTSHLPHLLNRGSSGDFHPKTIPVSAMCDSDLVIGSFLEQFNQDLIRPMIELMFYRETFFSLMWIENSCSVVIPSELVDFFPADSLNFWYGKWKVLRIGDEPLGFDDCGIVNKYTRVLSDNSIPVCYLSTFMHDLIIVQEQDFDNVLILVK